MNTNRMRDALNHFDAAQANLAKVMAEEMAKGDSAPRPTLTRKGKAAVAKAIPRGKRLPRKDAPTRKVKPPKATAPRERKPPKVDEKSLELVRKALGVEPVTTADIAAVTGLRVPTVKAACLALGATRTGTKRGTRWSLA
jgi:hypothetical protein